MSDASKAAKIIKRWYYSTAHWQLGDVMVSDITFFIRVYICAWRRQQTTWVLVLGQFKLLLWFVKNVTSVTVVVVVVIVVDIGVG